MPKRKLIIDTDPGTDDVLALLLAFAASEDEIEVVLVSVTYGNVDIKGCLRNVVSMFNVIEKEMAWRREQGVSEGFEGLKKRKPVVAVGATEPLGGQVLMADYYLWLHARYQRYWAYRVSDMNQHPHHTSHPDLWEHLFDAPPRDSFLSATASGAARTDRMTHAHLFEPSSVPSHLEIIRILDSEPPETITLLAIGPLTTFALAASHSPRTFLRAKEVIVMGGTIHMPGNITPVAEFNCIADPIAAARVHALTSPDPASTMPPSALSDVVTRQEGEELPPYPPKEQLGEKRLNIALFPLDITTPHTLTRHALMTKTRPLIKRGSPLAEWVTAFLSATFDKSEQLYHDSDVGICFHDPVCVWYIMSSVHDPELWKVKKGEDMRVETTGQWTRGMCVVDERGMRMREGEEESESGDQGGWLSRERGNRVGRCVGTPGAEKFEFEGVLLKTIFGEQVN